MTSPSTKTGGITPIVISMALAPSPLASSTSPPPSSSDTISATPTTTNAPLSSAPETSSSSVVHQSKSNTDDGGDTVTISPPTSITSNSPTFESTVAFPGLDATSTASASLVSVKPSKSSAGLSGAAAAGLGVTMGILAFLVTAGVLYAVFGRNVRGLRREGVRE